MTNPIIAEKSPRKVQLEASKTYYWCRCGRSKNQPYCDGAHSGTEFSPLKFTAEETKTVFLCRCKHTGNSPYCDGAHSKL